MIPPMHPVPPDTACGVPSRLSRRAAHLAVLLLLAVVPPADATATAPEEVFATFDLAGWQRLGVVVATPPPLDEGGVDALLDFDPRTFARAPGTDEAEFALAFRTPQVLRRVAITAAGDSRSEVTLVVEDAGGSRFQAGRVEVAPGEPAVFRLADVECAVMRVTVARSEPGDTVALAGIEATGRLAISALAVEGVPETIPEGGSFPYRIVGRDSFGGRPDLTDRATLVVTPQKALIVTERRGTTRVQGPLTLEARLGALAGPLQSLLVTPLLDPPPAPEARPGLHLVELRLAGDPPFEIFRRHSGDKASEPIGRTERNLYYDDAVQPGSAFSYSARRVDLLGNPLSPVGPETRARTLTRFAPGQRELARFPVLVPLFVDSLQPGEAADIRDGVRAACQFAYRHVLGRFLFDPVFLEVPGRTPSTTGPLMVGIEARLAELGIEDDRYAAVFAFAGDLAGDYGGFRLLGRTGGAFGRGVAPPTTPGAMGADPAAAWVFLHELHHIGLSLLEEQEGGPVPLPSGHPEQDFGSLGVLGSARGRPFDAGEGWDQLALTLAAYDPWPRLDAPWRHTLEVLDSDGDGLADEDDRLPIDEARLGTDPHRADTDGDGLTDLAELAAGIDRGANPLVRDTDGDGLLDGADPWPLSNFTGSIRRGPVPRFLVSLPDPARPDAPPIEVSACWTSQALTLEIVTATPSDVFVELDGSGRLGRWETDVNIGTDEEPASDVWAGPARLALRAHTQPLGVFSGKRPVPGALVAAERESGGRQRLIAVLPARLGPGAKDVAVPEGAPWATGLRLAPGTVLGIGLVVRPARERDPAPFDPYAADDNWTSLFEPGRLLDARLED